jgi:hypothetical protein
MRDDQNVISNRQNRRSFLKTGLATAGAVTLSAGLLEGTRVSAQSSSLTEGDIAILQFLAAGELLEGFSLRGYSARDLVAGLVRRGAGPFDFEFSDALQEDAFKLSKIHGIACSVRGLLQLFESRAERFYGLGHGSQRHF